MNRHILLAAGFLACVPKTDDALTPAVVEDPPALDDGHVDADEFFDASQRAGEALERLAALDFLSVGELIVDAPVGDQNCYGPCVDDPIEQAWMQEHTRQVARLEAFTTLAEQVRADEDAVSSTPYDQTASLDALNALGVVVIDDVQWETGGACYVSACPSDDVRRVHITKLVEATSTL